MDTRSARPRTHHPHLRRVFLAVASLAAATLLLGSAEVRAGATIRVAPNAAPTDDGKCSLEEAIEAANTDTQVDACEAGVGDDVIEFDVYRTESNMTIEGHADGTTIKGGGGFRIIMSTSDIAQATDVTLANMTVTGSDGPGVHIKDNGGTSLTADITATLKNLHLHNNQIGARFDREPKSGRPGAVRIEDTVISGNSRTGIWLEACDPGDPLSRRLWDRGRPHPDGGGQLRCC